MPSWNIESLWVSDLTFQGYGYEYHTSLFVFILDWKTHSSLQEYNFSLAAHMFVWGRYWHICIQAPFNQRCIMLISCLGRILRVWYLESCRFLFRGNLPEILPSWQRHQISFWSCCIVICSCFKLTCWYGNGAFRNVIYEWLRAQGACMLLGITWGRWHWNINMSFPSLHLCVIYQTAFFVSL